MEWYKLYKAFGFFLSPNRLLHGIRNPKSAIFGHLIPIVKHPGLFYKTRNVPGLITPEVGVAIYEEILKNRHKSTNIVEVGIYKGLSTIYLAEAAKRVHKKVKSFDWFSGLTNVDPMLDPDFRVGECISDVKEWEANIRKNSSRKTVDLVIGDARQTMVPSLNNDGFAVAFLDVDLYDTTRELLSQLRSLTTGGEVIFIHNAESPGIRKAINDFYALWKYPINIKEQYFAGNIVVKLTIPGNSIV